ncbi:MAG: hypothetical protein KDB22_10575 [Planctomycetales bacterium]|nr:hypothetical protein [Planctomycetales bacterium]
MFKIPRRIDDLLPADTVQRMLDAIHSGDIATSVREVMGKVGVKDLRPIEKMQAAWQQTRSWLDSISGDTVRDSVQSTINATGQLFGPGFCNVPLASVVGYGYAKSAMAFQSGDQVLSRAQLIGRKCLGCSHVVWLTGASAAIRLLAQSLEIEEVLIARTDLIRIDNFGDIGQLLAFSGIPVTEVGASNGNTIEDWKRSLTSSRQLVLHVSPNGLEQEEAAKQRSRASHLAREIGATTVELLIDGVASSALAEQFRFPLIKEHLQDPAAIAIVPLNFLLGGPAGVFVAGNNPALEQIQQNAGSIGVATMGPTLVASTTALQLSSLGDELEAAATADLCINPDNLRDRAKRLSIQLDGVNAVSSATVVARSVELGPSPWHRYRHDSWAVQLLPKHSVSELTQLLAKGKLGPPIFAASSDQHVLLDLRFVPPSLDHELVNAIVAPTEERKESSAETSPAAPSSHNNS